MRAPDFERDCWCLEDGEEYHLRAPKTFFIPDLEVRKILQPGDFAKLIFKIAVEGDACPEIERMWVIVRERRPGGYVGMVDNQPNVGENDRLWLGTELPFEYRHIIDVDHGNQQSVAAAWAPVPIPWDRSK